MAFSTFYINGNSLSEATSVWTDVNLTILAADDYYSDGVVVRRQSGGVLLSNEACPACSTLCDNEVEVISSNPGIFNVSVNMGTVIGAVRIEYDVAGYPDSIKATWDSNIYNKMSSEYYGYLNNYSGTPSSATNPVWIGNTTLFCPSGPAPVPIPPNPPITLDVYNYNNGTLSPTGTTEAITIAAADIQVTPGSPGKAVMYIPKDTAGPSNVEFRMESICLGTVFRFTVFCPAPLTPLDTSVVDATQLGACALPLTQQLYLGNVTGVSAAQPGQYDWVFTNANSGAGGVNTYAAQGFYKYNHPFAPFNRWFEVGPNGTILNLGNC